MARKFFVLLRMQMYGLFSINKTIHKKGDKNYTKLVLLGIGGLIIIGLLSWYSYFMAYSQAFMGLANQIPIINLIIATMIIATFTFMKANGLLFGYNDYDMMMSLPVSSFIVILSRLTTVYLVNLLYSAIIFIPSIIVYINYATLTASGFIMYLLAMFLAPLLPMTVMIVAGTLISAITSFFKYKNLIAVLLMFGFLGAYLYFVFAHVGATQATPTEEQLAEFGRMVSDYLGRLYSLAGWLNEGIENSNWLSFGLFAIVSIIPIILYTAITSKFYIAINTRMSHFRKKSNFKMGELKTKSPFMAMYKRELRRMFSNATVTINMITGEVLTVAIAVAVVIMGVDGVLNIFGLADAGIDTYAIMGQAASVMPIAILFLAGMLPFTCVALSLEGKSRWIMLSIPVSSTQIFNSKIAAALTVLLPSALIASVLLTIALTPNLVTLFFLFLLPLSNAFFMTIFAMFINIKFPKYDWKSEYALLKGFHACTLIVMLVGIFLPLILIVVAIALIEYIIIMSTLLALVFIILSAVLYLLIIKEKLFD